MSVQTSVHDERPVFHCNRCLTELKLFEDAPTSADRVLKRFWTSCQHILCHGCRINNICAACNQKCRFMEISRRMPKYYQFYFESLWRMEQQLIGVIKFQLDQDTLSMNRFLAEVKRLNEKGRNEQEANNRAKIQFKQTELNQRKMKIIHQKIADEKRRQIEMSQRKQHQPSRRNSKDHRMEHRRNEQQQFDWAGREHSQDRNRGHAKPIQHTVNSQERRQSHAHAHAQPRLSPNCANQQIQLGCDSRNVVNDRNHRVDYRQNPQQQLNRRHQNQVSQQIRPHGATYNPRDSHRNATPIHDASSFSDDASQLSQQSFDLSHPFGNK